IVSKGRDASGAFFVDLQLTNSGTGHARGVNLNQLLLRTLTGTGTATLSAPPLPIAAGNLDVGASTTIRLTLNVPSTVAKFSITENGTLRDVAATSLNFSIGQAVIP
ncbi:MAG TPA: hypothetical protein VI382_00265, partial [Candidatus Manganitrophaceae bacterium]|nr:hypothetical protein [Candidatus Manganitrophaceae bacterium]